MSKLISLKRLREAFPEEAVLIRGVIDGSISPLCWSSVRRWVDRCFHTPDARDLELAALNDILNGHGVEVIRPDPEDHPAAEYINMGDTYDATILWDWERGKWWATTWGDWVEAEEKRGRKFQ